MIQSGVTRLQGKVAVVTGAASGIGRALALEAARHGMGIALADIDEDRLSAALGHVEAFGVEAVAVRTDVSKLDEMMHLRDRTVRELDIPWLVINGADTTKLTLTWDHSETSWHRVFDINLMGVVNSLVAFMPCMRERGSGHIVNTASEAGLVTIPAARAYVASKHAVVGLSQALYHELQATKSDVGVSVLCPSLVRTAILEGQMLCDRQDAASIKPAHILESEHITKRVFEAIIARRFWILMQAIQLAPVIRARTEQIVQQVNPDPSSIDQDATRSSDTANGIDFV